MSTRSLLDRAIIGPAIVESFKKLDPRIQVRNTVMFVCEVGALVTLIYAIHDAMTSSGQLRFDIAISFWLWFTVLFANFAEAMAEGRGKAQADYLRRTKTDTIAKRLVGNAVQEVNATELRKGDRIRVIAGELIPADGDIVEAQRPSMNRRSPANRPPSSAKRAATAAGSPAEPASSPIRSSSS